MRNTHIGAALVVIPLCLWCLFWLIPNNSVPPTSDIDLSPALVPSIAIGACLLTGLAMLVRALRADGRTRQELDEEFGSEATGINAAVLVNLVWLVLAGTGSWLLITHVGFEPAMTVLLIAVMLYVGVRNPVTIVLTALLMPIVLSLAAWYFFSTEMPAVWR